MHFVATKNGVVDEDPITFERWVEITEAQRAGALQGIDAAAVLASYGLTPNDWGGIGGWWSQKLDTRGRSLQAEYERLTQHYTAKFAAGFSPDLVSD